MTLQLVSEWLKGPTENVFIYNNFFYRNIGDITEQWDITNPSNPVLVNEYPHTGIAVGGSYQIGRFLVANDKCFVVSNFTDGAKIVQLDTGIITMIGTESSVQGIAIYGNNLILAQISGVRIYDISNPLIPTLVRTITNNGSYGVYTNGEYIVSIEYSDYRTISVYSWTGTWLWGYSWTWTDAGFCVTDHRNNYLSVVMDVAFLQSYIAMATRKGQVVYFDYMGNMISHYPPDYHDSSCDAGTVSDGYATATKIAAYGPDSVVAAFHDYTVKQLQITGTTVTETGTFNYVQAIGGYPRSIFVSGNTMALANSYKGACLVSLPNMSLLKIFEGYDRVNAVLTSTDRKYAFAGGDATFATYKMDPPLMRAASTDYGHPARTWWTMTTDRSRGIVFVPATWGGLKIIDIRNPLNPIVLKQFEVVDPSIQGYNYCDAISDPLGNNRILMESIPGRLIMIDYSDATNPTVVGNVLNLGTDFFSIATSPDGKYAYLGAYPNSQMFVVDISDPQNKTLVRTINLPSYINKLKRIGTRLWATVANNGLTFFDITTPANPIQSTGGYYNPHGNADALCQLGMNQLIVGMTDHLMRLDVSTPGTPVLMEDIHIPAAEIVFADFIPNGNTLVISCYTMGLKIYTDPTIDPGPVQYNCSGEAGGYQCYPVDSGGAYPDLASCKASCKSTSLRYNCTGPAGGYQCVPAPNGTYPDLTTCLESCKAPVESGITNLKSSILPLLVALAGIAASYLKHRSIRDRRK